MWVLWYLRTRGLYRLYGLSRRLQVRASKYGLPAGIADVAGHNYLMLYTGHQRNGDPAPGHSRNYFYYWFSAFYFWLETSEAPSENHAACRTMVQAKHLIFTPEKIMVRQGIFIYTVRHPDMSPGPVSLQNTMKKEMIFILPFITSFLINRTGTTGKLQRFTAVKCQLLPEILALRF